MAPNCALQAAALMSSKALQFVQISPMKCSLRVAMGHHATMEPKANLCGQQDVQDNQNATYGTDFHIGMFSNTPNRRLKNKFTTPFVPPTGGLRMFGTATGIKDIPHMMEEQKEGGQGEVFPDLKTREKKMGNANTVHEMLSVRW